MPTSKSLIAVLALIPTVAFAAELPVGYWGLEKTQPLLDAALKIRLAPDLSHLSEAERRALPELLEAGRVLNDNLAVCVR